MIQYLDLLRHVMEQGKFKADRTGTGTFSVFGAQARVSDPNKVVTTLVLDLDETSNSANLALGSNIRLTRGAPTG